MRPKGPLLIIPGITVFAVLLAGILSACVQKPTSAPSATLTPTPKPALVVGMKIGERFHDIHTNTLAIQCTYCHVKEPPTYDDPLAQAVDPVDKRACLSCHKEGGVQPFYGEEWTKAKVER